MLCHCDRETEPTKTFAPGHDQKLRAKLQQKTGGLINLERLVDAAEAFAKGKSSAATLESITRKIFTP
jgi:hypothetical protein